VPTEHFNNFTVGVPNLTTFQPNNTWHVSDGFEKGMGRHTLKFGGEFRYLQINERNTCAPNGDFTFDGSETGTDFADFLLGAPQNYNQCSQQFLDSRTRYAGAYAEDTYKLKQNVTLNLGLRWEVSMPWWDTRERLRRSYPGCNLRSSRQHPRLGCSRRSGYSQHARTNALQQFLPTPRDAYSPGLAMVC